MIFDYPDGNHQTREVIDPELHESRNTLRCMELAFLLLQCCQYLFSLEYKSYIASTI